MPLSAYKRLCNVNAAMVPYKHIGSRKHGPNGDDLSYEEAQLNGKHTIEVSMIVFSQSLPKPMPLCKVCIPERKKRSFKFLLKYDLGTQCKMDEIGTKMSFSHEVSISKSHQRARAN